MRGRLSTPLRRRQPMTRPPRSQTHRDGRERTSSSRPTTGTAIAVATGVRNPRCGRPCGRGRPRRPPGARVERARRDISLRRWRRCSTSRRPGRRAGASWSNCSAPGGSRRRWSRRRRTPTFGSVAVTRACTRRGHRAPRPHHPGHRGGRSRGAAGCAPPSTAPCVRPRADRARATTATFVWLFGPPSFSAARKAFVSVTALSAIAFIATGLALCFGAPPSGRVPGGVATVAALALPSIADWAGRASSHASIASRHGSPGPPGLTRSSPRIAVPRRRKA